MENDTLSKLQGIFESTFDEVDGPITPETSPRTMEDWDSIMHVELILAIEKEFGVRLTSRQVAECTQVAKIIEVLGRHGAK